MPTIRARELFLATLLNPKALLFASAIFPNIVWKSRTLCGSYAGFLASVDPDCLLLDFYGFNPGHKKKYAGSISTIYKKRLHGITELFHSFKLFGSFKSISQR